MQILSDTRFQYTSSHNKYHTCIVKRVVFIHIPRYCKSFNHSSLTVIVAESSKALGWKAGVACSIRWRHLFSF